MCVFIFVGKLVEDVVDRNCWKSRGITGGCGKFSRNKRIRIPSLSLDATKRSGKEHLGRLGLWGEEDIGDSFWPDLPDIDWPEIDWPEDIPLPDWLRNSSGPLKDVLMVQNYTVCSCNTDLCNDKCNTDMCNGNGNDNDNGNDNGNGNGKTGNDSGGSSLQTSGSSYFVVICVLILAALITLSTTIDD